MTEDNAPIQEALPVSRRTWMRTTAFALAFTVSGGVIGSAATIVTLRERAQRTERDPQWLSGRVADRLTKRLDLTPEQSEQVRAIFEEHHEKARAFRETHRDRARAYFEELRADIESVLTPDQADEWRLHLEEMRERAMKDGSRHRRGGGDKSHRRDETSQ